MRRTLWTGVIAATVSGAVALKVGRDVVNPQGLPVLEMVWPLVPLLLGEVVRTRRELLAEYAARAVRAEEDREREAARRVRQERARVAREIHDILAHTVSAMTVQAGVALDALDTAPEVSRQAMAQVRASGKEAVRELRATLSVLRAAQSTAPAFASTSWTSWSRGSRRAECGSACGGTRGTPPCPRSSRPRRTGSCRRR